MKLLAIETSTSTYSVTLTDGATTYWTAMSSRFDADYDGIGGLVHRQLAAHAWKADDLSGIAVCSGPGNRISVRAGLSYANALAFATGAPLHHTNTLAVIAFLARQAVPADAPVLVLYPARGQQGSLLHTGLFATDGTALFGMHDAAEPGTPLPSGVPEIILAGAGARRAPLILDATAVHDSGVVQASSEALVKMFRQGLLVESRSPVSPTTEESGFFNGRVRAFNGREHR